MNIELLIIDPQNDFCDPKGALTVPGGDADMIRLSAMLDRLGHKIKKIHVTLDSHHLVDIAHPIFLVNSKGQHPDPFTIIPDDEIQNGIWRATYEPFQQRLQEYSAALASNNKYPLCVWPPHCLIGSWGYSVFPKLFESLIKWEDSFAMVDYVTKGSNYWTEHYSAVQADVPDPADPGTQLNWDLLNTLQQADVILMAGEALSHCLAYTVKDIADNFGEENIKKMVLLQDATSAVGDPPGTTLFTDYANNFINEMVSRGMQLSTTVDYLK